TMRFSQFSVRVLAMFTLCWLFALFSFASLWCVAVCVCRQSLLGETESLWRALCRRAHPTVSESEKPDTSTWKSWFALLASRKHDKVAALQQKLQNAMKNQEKEKQKN